MKKPSHTWTDPKTGNLYAVYTFTNRFGQRRFVYRRARNVTHARDLYKEMEQEHKQKGEAVIEAARMTFDRLADYAEKHYIKPPVYSEGRKVSGMRSWKSARSGLEILRRHFGHLKIRDITAEDLKEFKELRLGTRTKRRGVRRISSVNRELALLRKVLHVALKKRWIPFSPFEGGQLISLADEVKRTRVLSRDEESRLLAACETTKRAHLRAIIICGIDTGMRSGEMFKLKWREVDLEGRRISLVAFNTKTETPRVVPITKRLLAEMERLWHGSVRDRESLVFGIVTNIKRSWKSACDVAGIRGATPHDLRHTAATRMIGQGMELAEVARILGHADIRTTYRYVNLTHDTVGKAMEAIDRFNEEHHEETSVVIQTEGIN